MKVAIQIAAVVVSAVAIAWGILCVYSVIFPGPSGEWAVLAILAAYVVGIPAGVVTLLVAFLVKQGSPALRRVCFTMGIITLLLPIASSAASVLHRHYR